jgi:hypothetical protein
MEGVEIGRTCSKIKGKRNAHKKLDVKSQSDWICLYI